MGGFPGLKTLPCSRYESGLPAGSIFQDAAADSDKDGYTNVEEFLNRTDPNQFVDYKDPANNKHSLH